mmetsp:Transcript_25183/g.69450  ORF Transcript_25183/g.69450 Transcript_25183/m.69450 type:complete len:275 (+) Transcript_25183:205-1029(+)
MFHVVSIAFTRRILPVFFIERSCCFLFLFVCLFVCLPEREVSRFCSLSIKESTFFRFVENFSVVVNAIAIFLVHIEINIVRELILCVWIVVIWIVLDTILEFELINFCVTHLIRPALGIVVIILVISLHDFHAISFAAKRSFHFFSRGPFSFFFLSAWLSVSTPLQSCFFPSQLDFGQGRILSQALLARFFQSLFPCRLFQSVPGKLLRQVQQNTKHWEIEDKKMVRNVEQHIQRSRARTRRPSGCGRHDAHGFVIGITVSISPKRRQRRRLRE